MSNFVFIKLYRKHYIRNSTQKNIVNHCDFILCVMFVSDTNYMKEIEIFHG